MRPITRPSALRFADLSAAGAIGWVFASVISVIVSLSRRS